MIGLDIPLNVGFFKYFKMLTSYIYIATTFCKGKGFPSRCTMNDGRIGELTIECINSCYVYAKRIPIKLHLILLCVYYFFSSWSTSVLCN